MTKTSGKKPTGVKKSNSKESCASVLITGAGMREPSVNPEPIPHLLPPQNSQHVAQAEVMKHGSTISRRDTTEKDRSGKFAFAGHPLQIDYDGAYFVDDGGVKLYNSTFKAQVNKAPRDARRLSASQFQEELVANDMIHWIRDRAVLQGQRNKDAQFVNRDLFGKRGPSRDILMKMINGIADLAESLFRSEPRVLKVDQPVIVFGDVHGNLADLMVYEKLFWKNYPTVLPWNYLFLGDYVDRSKYSLETVLYLLSQKIVARQKFLLLRGNHEFRTVNRTFSFYKELVTILGPSDGDKVWARLNQVFDCMPMCAVIGSKVFCCHGGVPSSLKDPVCSLRELESISCPYRGPDVETADTGGAAWELMWNDPMDKHEFAQVLELNRPEGETAASALQHGFAPNTKRQTGKYFSEVATRNFIAHNGFDYIIRAHECIHHGYQTKHNGLTTTVFSSSGYSNNNNAAVVMVHDNRIRPVRIQTRPSHSHTPHK